MEYVKWRPKKKNELGKKENVKMDLASFVISFCRLRRRRLWILGVIPCIYKRCEWFLGLVGALISKQLSVTPVTGLCELAGSAMGLGWPRSCCMVGHPPAWLTSLHNPDALFRPGLSSGNLCRLLPVSYG